MEEEIKGYLEECKTKIQWELANNDNIEMLIFMDGKVNCMGGKTELALNGLSNLVYNLKTKVGIPDFIIKRAVKVGLKHKGEEE